MSYAMMKLLGRHSRESGNPFTRHRDARPWIPAFAGMTVVLLMSPTALADKIFVSNEKDNTVTVLDGDSLKITDTIKVGQRPRDIHLSTDGKNVYVCASDSDRIEVLDIATMKIVRKLPSGPDPERFDTSPMASCSISPTRMITRSRSSISRSARLSPRRQSGPNPKGWR